MGALAGCSHLEHSLDAPRASLRYFFNKSAPDAAIGAVIKIVLFLTFMSFSFRELQHRSEASSDV
jgi:hypothetical protein